MLKKVLMICTLTCCGVIGLQAMEQERSSSIEQNNEENQKVRTNEENEKDLAPGILVCNEEEEHCVKEELFSVFCDEHEEEDKLLACKDCR